MQERNETSFQGCRYLDSNDFPSLYEAFTGAFADYVVPFALTETQLKNHIVLTAVDLERSVGYFDGGNMVGFSLNGFGTWNDRPTVYDACTGVMPAARRHGMSAEMFRFMLPDLEDSGIEQFLLEVITSNVAAIGLYKKLGFRAVRQLVLLQCDDLSTSNTRPAIEIEIREIVHPDWDRFKTFWDGSPSWQNSPEAVDRSLHLKRTLGAFYDGQCVGSILSSARFGRVSQLAVSKDHRRLGIGSALVNSMHFGIERGYSAQVVNADLSLPGLTEFFAKLGYYERLRQHEMVLDL